MCIRDSSIYDPSELDTLCSRYQFDIVQAPFNVLDRRLIDSGWLECLHGLGTELHVRSVFLQGLLLMRSDERPKKFNRWSALWSLWEDWLKQKALTPVQACIRHVFSFLEISKVILGVNSVRQLKEILNDADGPMMDLPAGLMTGDIDLLNPARWHALN